jgi:hypothetical protein
MNPVPAYPTTAIVTKHCHGVPRLTVHFSQLRVRLGLSTRVETNIGVPSARSPYFFRIRVSYTMIIQTGKKKKKIKILSKTVASNPKFKIKSPFKIPNCNPACGRSQE